MHDVFMLRLFSFFSHNDQTGDKLLKWNGAYPVHPKALGFLSGWTQFFEYIPHQMLLSIHKYKVHRRILHLWNFSDIIHIDFSGYCHTLIIILGVAFMCNKLWTFSVSRLSNEDFLYTRILTLFYCIILYLLYYYVYHSSSSHVISQNRNKNESALIDTVCSQCVFTDIRADESTFHLQYV